MHLKHRRTPIAGDEAYGNNEWNKKLARSDKVHRPLLHAYETVFVHPFTGETVRIRAPVPADMRRVMEKLKESVDDHLVDEETGLLLGDTWVESRPGGQRGLGFVPMDRLVMKEVGRCNEVSCCVHEYFAPLL